jgi:hypothetical protein
MTEANFALRMKEKRQMSSLENDEETCCLPNAREKRAQDLGQKQAREKLGQEHLEKIARLFRDALAEFWAGAPGKPVVDLTLSSPEAPSGMRIRIDDSGRVVDVSDELSSTSPTSHSQPSGDHL